MHLLAVFAHPVRSSFSGDLVDALGAGAAGAGATVEIADLYREGFDPRFEPDDFAQFSGEAMPDAVRREQARIDRADAIAFVFPVWWWSFPAILKGWVDRVFSEGWAYSFEPGRSRGLLRDRPTALIATGGSSEKTWSKYGYREAMATQIDTGILGYCGLRDVETRLIYAVEQDEAARLAYLAEIRALGAALVDPTRQPRDPLISSDRPV